MWPPPSQSPLGSYYKAAVAADNVLCSDVGRDILVLGGNAVDAGVAAVLCTGVMDSHSCGLGGGHFTTIYNRTTKTCIAIDARERAPLAATTLMYAGNASLSKIGWLAIGVPGEIAGLFRAWQLGGSLPWRTLLQPTINLLSNGYPVSEALAEALQVKRDTILGEPTMQSIWVNPATGSLYLAGDVMRRPILARTIDILASAQDPAGLFYNGTIANQIVAEFRSVGALITSEDLRRYEAIVRPTVVATLANGLSVCGPPPPSSAAVAAAIFNIVAGYPFSSTNQSDPHAAAVTYHKMIEAMKFAYAERSTMGDSSFGPGNLTLAANITSSQWADAIRARITDRAHDPAYYGGSFSRSDHGTAHISVLDEKGNAMSTTSTINLYFGSNRRSPATGIIWNDEMDDFSTPGIVNAFGFQPSPSNFIVPGKRPMSSMSPIVIYNSTSGDVHMVVGAAGGSRITTSTAYVALRTLLFNQTVKQAIDSPRLHNQLYPTFTQYDEGFPAAYVDALRGMGHNMTQMPVSSVVTGIARRDGRVQANSDFRKGSTAGTAGF